MHIHPSPDRSNEEKERLRAFEHTLDELDISTVVEKAKDVMGLTGNDKAFSTDILRVEISGPTQPHLTMVDLPGLFLAGNKDQSEDDAELVKRLVLGYMKKPRSIILAVVSAKSDFNLQQVTKHAQKLDPNGIRTLGLITKPDTLDRGSDSERFFVELAQNKDVEFRLGWHILRNRDYAMRDVSTLERDEKETAFFSESIWTELLESQLGVVALRERLSNVLRNQILMQLPSVLEDVEAGLELCRNTLHKLGASRASNDEQRRYLFNISTKFSSLLQAAIDGQYTDVYFSDNKQQPAYPKRLRAVLQNTLTEFAEEMRTRGHTKTIDEETTVTSTNARVISRSAYLEEVKLLMKETRGRELPRTYNPLIVAELFSKQSRPWSDIVDKLCKRVLDATYITVDTALRHTADEQTVDALLRKVVEPSMEELKKSLSSKVEEILKPHVSGHPITYNHYLTDNVQKVQAKRHRQELEKRLSGFLQSKTQPTDLVRSFDMKALLDTLLSGMEPDMDKYSCSMATDMMQAYYKASHFVHSTTVLRLTEDRWL